MHTHTAHAELVGLLQNAGASPETIINFNGLLLEKPHLSDWLSMPSHERDRVLSDQREAAARHYRNLIGGPQ